VINRIVDFYLVDLQQKGIKFDDLFEDSEFNRIADLIYKTNLPKISMIGKYIDTTRLPQHTKKLYDNFEDRCYSYDSTFITVNDYSLSKCITAMLIEKLYKRCLIEDVTIPHLLYIDTESLVSDLSKLMTIDKNDALEEMIFSLQNDKQIIYKDLYTADCVFWDKFDFNYSQYFSNYIYEIIKNRYNNCLPNIFFSDKQMGNFFSDVNNRNLNEVMNIGVNLSLKDEADKIQMIGGNE